MVLEWYTYTYLIFQSHNRKFEGWCICIYDFPLGCSQFKFPQNTWIMDARRGFMLHKMKTALIFFSFHFLETKGTSLRDMTWANQPWFNVPYNISIFTTAVPVNSAKLRSLIFINTMSYFYKLKASNTAETHYALDTSIGSLGPIWLTDLTYFSPYTVNFILLCLVSS